MRRQAVSSRRSADEGLVHPCAVAGLRASGTRFFGSAACPPRVGPALCTLYGGARNGIAVRGVLLGWHDPVGGDAMSGLVMGFAERRYRDALDGHR